MLQKTLQGTSVVMNPADAGALAKRQEVVTNPLLRNYSRHASSRASEDIRRAVKDSTSKVKELKKELLSRESAPVPEIEDAQGMTPSRRSALEREAKAKRDAARRFTRSNSPDTKDVDKGWES
jgi:hypothetical protein